MSSADFIAKPAPQLSNAAGTRMVIMQETVAATMTNACELAARVTNESRHLLTVDQAGLLDLGLTEAMTNIVRHANADAASIRTTDIVDHGSRIPEDVLAQDEDAAFNFDPNDLESIPEGGMGIGLIKKSFDGLAYTVHAGINTMHLEMQLSDSLPLS